MKESIIQGAKKILFIDRDGTLVNEAPPSYRIDTFEKLVFYPMVFHYLYKIATKFNYELVMVTNQDGLGRDEFPYDKFSPVHDFILKSFANEGIRFSEILIDCTYPNENAATRKPGTGLLINYMNNPGYDIAHSFVIGDRITDMQLAKNLNCKGFWLCSDEKLGAAELTSEVEQIKSTSIALTTPHWKNIYAYLNQINQ